MKTSPLGSVHRSGACACHPHSVRVQRRAAKGPVTNCHVALPACRHLRWATAQALRKLGVTVLRFNQRRKALVMLSVMAHAGSSRLLTAMAVVAHLWAALIPV